MNMSGRREAAGPGGNQYRLVAVSFGLLCVVQVSLNISLRLILYSELQASYNILAEKHQRLQSECSSTTHEQEQLQLMLENMSITTTAALSRVRETKLQMKTLMDMVLDLVITDAEHPVREADGGRHETLSLETSCNTLMDKQDLLQTEPENRTGAGTGCVYFRGSYYFASPTEQSWLQSRIYCLQRSADLVVISSDREQEFVSRFQRPAWIGLTDREDEGRWRWVDGTPLGTQYWMESQPNEDSDVDEDCAEITTSDSARSWNDASCSQKKFCICEKTLTSDLV